MGTSVTSVAYDVENRVTQITYPSSATNTFAYNGEDLRTQKVDSGGAKNYVCDGSSPASAVLKDGAAVYTPGLSERRGSASKFLHADALGSTRGITDSSQTVTDAMLYDAFGNTLSRTGTTPTPFGFVGSQQYQSDSDSGLQLLGHRYYDPSIGRFLSQDPIHDGTNWYAYCDNNPLANTDAQGLDDNPLLPPALQEPDPYEQIGMHNPFNLPPLEPIRPPAATGSTTKPKPTLPDLQTGSNGIPKHVPGPGKIGGTKKLPDGSTITYGLNDPTLTHPFNGGGGGYHHPFSDGNSIDLQGGGSSSGWGFGIGGTWNHGHNHGGLGYSNGSKGGFISVGVGLSW